MARLLSLSSPNPSSSHLPLLAGFFLALIAVTAVISALCASHHRKSRRRSPSPATSASEPQQDNNFAVLPAAIHGPIGPVESVVPMTPRRKLSMSLSLKIPEGLTRVRTGRREAAEKERKSAAAADDAVWMKTIILGEKCRVPDDDETGEDGGGRQRIYHPRTPRSVPLSRSTSLSRTTSLHLDQ